MEYNLCIIKPNRSSFSETFIQAHIENLAGNKKVLYGGTFPVYDHEGNFLIRSYWSILSYLIKKRLFKQDNIIELNKALSDYLIAQNIDVVLAEYGMVGAKVMAACRMANVPLVIHFHGADAHHRPTIEKYKQQYEESFKYAKAIVVVSEDMRASLVKLGAPTDKLFLNPYGIDVDKFSPVNVSLSAINFIAVGRFVSKKAPLITIEAFRLLTDSYKNAHLWMVGDGPLLASAKQKAKELNMEEKITFTGILSSAQIIGLFKKMRCFVQHSVTAIDGDMEGTPNTILEASSSALPIISTRHAGIKDAVINGVTGFLVEEYDVTGTTEKMKAIAGSAALAARLGEAGRMHMIRNYQMKDRIKALDRIIQNCISPVITSTQNG